MVSSGNPRAQICERLCLIILQADEAGHESKPPPLSNVISDGCLAMIAGSDTTAMGIASLFYLLLSSPDKLEKLKEEVDRVYPRDEDEKEVLNSSRHGKLIYLNACLYVLVC
jgi:cytochrome P450